MNLERISFRTNEKERQLLTELNERYRCKTITSLMHRLLEKVADNKLLEDEQNGAAKIFGDLDIMDIPTLEKTHLPKEKNAQTENLASRALINPNVMTTFNQKTFSQSNATKEVEEKRYDPFEEFLKEVYDLEKLKQAIERTYPIRTIPSSFHS